MERANFKPFTGGVQLSEEPDGKNLAMVLWQVRWASLTHLRTEQLFVDAVSQLSGPFLDYPFFANGSEYQIELSPNGVTHSAGNSVARWESKDRNWLIVLSAQSLTLCSLGPYEGFEVFAERAANLMAELSEKLRIPEVERVAVRYVNRYKKNDAVSVENLFPRLERRIEVDSEDVEVIDSVNYIAMQVGEARLNARSGMIRENETVDPAILPLAEPTWVLDIDATLESRIELEEVTRVAGHLADIDYDFFLWSQGLGASKEEAHG